jgi:hypothetical protein
MENVAQHSKLRNSPVLNFNFQHILIFEIALHQHPLKDRPKGSKNPKGGCAPIASLNDIFNADDLVATEAGENALAPTREAIKRVKANIL